MVSLIALGSLLLSPLSLQLLEFPASSIPGAALVVVGLSTLNLIPPLAIRRVRSGRGVGSPLLIGMVFSVGWTPCATPSIALMSLLAGSVGSSGSALAIAASYMCGIALPLTAAAYGATRIRPVRDALRRIGNGTQVASGVSLVGSGLLFATGLWAVMANWLLTLDPTVL